MENMGALLFALDGRASRKDYFVGSLVVTTLVVLVIVTAAAFMLFGSGGITTYASIFAISAAVLVFAWSIFVMTAKRCRDAGWPVWVAGALIVMDVASTGFNFCGSVGFAIGTLLTIIELGIWIVLSMAKSVPPSEGFATQAA